MTKKEYNVFSIGIDKKDKEWFMRGVERWLNKQLNNE